MAFNNKKWALSAVIFSVTIFVICRQTSYGLNLLTCVNMGGSHICNTAHSGMPKGLKDVWDPTEQARPVALCEL